MNINFDRWAILTIVMVAVALFFGLRPRAWFVENDAHLLPAPGGLQFGGNGIAFVRDLHLDLHDDKPAGFTIELAATPGSDRSPGFSPLLVISDGTDERQLAVWQYQRALIVMNGDDYDYQRRQPRLVARNVLTPDQEQLLTITSGAQGTRLYIDGEHAAAMQNWRLTFPQRRPLHLVLGNSIYAKHGWIGRLHGLAIFAESMDAESIKQRFDRWSVDHTFTPLSMPSLQVLYTFAESSDQSVKDESGGSQHLHLPVHLQALKRSILSMPGKAARWNRNLMRDMLINILGFIPLGLVFAVFLMRSFSINQQKRVWLAVAMCLLLSLSIEIVQAWIPNRTSSLPDLMLNTIGGWIGVMLANKVVAGKGMADGR